MSPEDRFLSDGTLAATRAYFELDSFLRKFPTSKENYFAVVSGLRSAFLNANCELTDLEIRDLVARALRTDRSYRHYVSKVRPTDFDYLLEPEKWQTLLLAMAGTVLCQYEEELG